MPGLQRPRTRFAFRPALQPLEDRTTPVFFDTTINLTSSPNPSEPGQLVTLSATVTAPAVLAPVPAGGLVSFFDDSVQDIGGLPLFLGSTNTDGNGLATIDVTSLTSGTHTLRTVYDGDVIFTFEPIFFSASEQTISQTVTSISPPPLPPPLPPPPSPELSPEPSPEPPPSFFSPEPGLVAGGTGAGDTGIARLLNPDGSVRFEVTPYGSGFTGGVRVAVGDVNGDGTGDLITSPGPGGAPIVRTFSGVDGSPLGQFEAFEMSFFGGTYVAAADLTGDGIDEIIVSPDQSGGPRVRILSGVNGAVSVADYFGIDDPNFRGGCRVAAGDVNGDGIPEVIVAAGFGGGPRVTVYDGASVAGAAGGAPGGSPLANFFAFEPELRNGAYVAAGDMTGDGFADLVFGGGPGGAPRLLGWDGYSLITDGPIDPDVLFDLFAFDESSREGVLVTIGDSNGDGLGDLYAASGLGGSELFYEGGSFRDFDGPVLDLGNGIPIELDGRSTINFTPLQPDFSNGNIVGGPFPQNTTPAGPNPFAGLGTLGAPSISAQPPPAWGPQTTFSNPTQTGNNPKPQGQQRTVYGVWSGNDTLSPGASATVTVSQAGSGLANVTVRITDPTTLAPYFSGSGTAARVQVSSDGLTVSGTVTGSFRKPDGSFTSTRPFRVSVETAGVFVSAGGVSFVN